MLEHQSVEEVQRELLRRIRTEGVMAAYEASLAVCRDPKAPAPARATASVTLFRAAGYFDRKERDDTKEPHEMSAEELQAEIRRIERSGQPKNEGSDIFD